MRKGASLLFSVAHCHLERLLNRNEVKRAVGPLGFRRHSEGEAPQAGSGPNRTTPKGYVQSEVRLASYEHPGRTNSRKHSWTTSSASDADPVSRYAKRYRGR